MSFAANTAAREHLDEWSCGVAAGAAAGARSLCLLLQLLRGVLVCLIVRLLELRSHDGNARLELV